MPGAAEGGVSRHARSGNRRSCLKKARSPLDTIAARSPGSLDTRGLRPRTRDDRGRENRFGNGHPPVLPSAARSALYRGTSGQNPDSPPNSVHAEYHRSRCIAARAISENHRSCLKKDRIPLNTTAPRSPGSLDTRGLRPRTRDDRGRENRFGNGHPPVLPSAARSALYRGTSGQTPDSPPNSVHAEYRRRRCIEARAISGNHRSCLKKARSPLDTIAARSPGRSEEHTSELQSLMRISYAVFCLKKKKTQRNE